MKVTAHFRFLAKPARRKLTQPIHPVCSAPRKPTWHRPFHVSPRHHVVKPYLLADIGEGIREVQIIQWFVKPGARVEQFQALCEVQSDKATVEITSRFDGVVQKLHYDADDMAQVGKPLVDIDIQGEIGAEDEKVTGAPVDEEDKSEGGEAGVEGREADAIASHVDTLSHSTRNGSAPEGRHATLATPAVRRLTRELNIAIESITGTGKDGRVLKEDVLNHSSQTQSQPPTPASTTTTTTDTAVPLTPIQSAMFKSMSRSLSIPHFLYTSPVDFTPLTNLRAHLLTTGGGTKISPLPFIIKALSEALKDHPILNARLDTTTHPSKPLLHYRSQHNIGVAVDTPAGLVVPVIKAVQDRSVREISAEIARLARAGRDGALTTAELSQGTFTVSNVGSIGGGGVVSPVLVEGQSGILGVGRARTVPGFDGEGNVVKREEGVLSWCADHRVVDGATVARAGEVVRGLLEGVGTWLVRLR